MQKIIPALFVTLFFFSGSQAQDKIDTDRPDQTESAVLTPKGFFQAEFGFNVEENDGRKIFVHPTALWKYGLSNRFELRLITEYISEETPIMIPQGNKIVSGLLPVEVGGRVALWEENGALPKTSFLFHVGIPAFSSDNFKPPHAAPSFRFSMAHTLTENIGLGYNMGVEWDGVDNTASWIYTIAPGISFEENWYAYIEAFGSIKKNEPAQHAIDGGLGFLTSANTKIDLSGGFGLTHAAPEWYIAIGFSCRFNTRKK